MRGCISVQPSHDEQQRCISPDPTVHLPLSYSTARCIVYLDLILEVIQVADTTAVLQLFQLRAQAFRKNGRCPSIQCLPKGSACSITAVETTAASSGIVISQ